MKYFRPLTVFAIIVTLLMFASVYRIGIVRLASAAVPAPGGVDANLQLWLKADVGVFNDAGTTPATDGQKVQEWHDQDSASNNATQATADLQPIYTANALNSNPVIDFGQDTDDFFTASSVDFGNDISEVIVVFGQAENVGVDIATGFTTGAFFDLQAGSDRWQVDTGLTVGSYGDALSSGYHIAGAQRDVGGGATAYLNGAVNGTLGSGVSTAIGAANWLIGKRGIGGNEDTSGQFAEVIVYNTSLSATDRQKVTVHPPLQLQRWISV